jgi:large subunit ribosomal protein L16|tara:strand:+ start:1541 stop:1963 length:423 start_codon:yes stop_codon:yes gene_type:complete
MLFPKKVKHRKWQTARKNVNKLRAETRGTTLAFGSYGMKAMTPARVKANQIEATRRVISRSLGKTGKVWIRIFPDRPFTKKAAEVGMGKGKGDPQGYEFEVRPGRVLFEIDGVSEEMAREALRKAGNKMPLKTKIISREH